MDWACPDLLGRFGWYRSVSPAPSAVLLHLFACSKEAMTGGEWRSSDGTCGDRAAVRLVTFALAAQAQLNRFEIDTLTCSMSSDIGRIVGSQRNLNCIFRGAPGEPEEAYREAR
jgi:Protein of unknown function (DUF992)